MRASNRSARFAVQGVAYPEPFEALAGLPDGGVAGYASDLFIFGASGSKRTSVRIGGGYGLERRGERLFSIGVVSQAGRAVTRVCRLDLKGRVEKAAVAGDRFDSCNLAVSPNAQRVATFVHLEKNAVRLFDGSLRLLAQRVWPAAVQVQSLAWLDDARLAVAHSAGIEVVSLPKLRTVARSSERALWLAAPLRAVAPWVAAATASGVHLLDERGKRRATIALKNASRLWVSPSGQRLVASVGKALFVVDLGALASNGLPAAPSKVALKGSVPVTSGAFSDDEQTFFLGRDIVLERLTLAAAPASAQPAAAPAADTLQALVASPPPSTAMLPALERVAAKARALPSRPAAPSLAVSFGAQADGVERWLAAGERLQLGFSRPERACLTDGLASLLRRGSTATLAGRFVNACPISRDSDCLLLSLDGGRAEVSQWFHDEPLEHALVGVADSLEALSLMAAAVVVQQQGSDVPSLAPLAARLTGRVHAVARFEELDELLVDAGTPLRDWKGSTTEKLWRRAQWLLALLGDDVDLKRARALHRAHAEPLSAFRAAAKSGKASQRPGDALYWLFHLFFSGEAQQLQALVESCSRSASPLVRDAASFVGAIDKARGSRALVKRRDLFQVSR